MNTDMFVLKFYEYVYILIYSIGWKYKFELGPLALEVPGHDAGHSCDYCLGILPNSSEYGIL